MVTATATVDRSSHLLGEAHGFLTLKVRSTEHCGRILRIRSPKCTIGSHPSCTLRLRAAGVCSFHCVILRGREGTFVRRWSGDTCLNGASFSDTRLHPGDRLNIGPIELEVLEPSSLGDGTASIPAAASMPGGTMPSLPHDCESPSCNTVLSTAGEDVSPSDSDCSGCDDSDQLDGRERDQKGSCEKCRHGREELAQLKQRLADQLAEQEELVGQAVAAREQVAELNAKLEALRQQADETQTRADAFQSDLTQQLKQRDEQLSVSEDRTTELQSQLQQAREQVQQAPEPDHELAEENQRLNDQWEAAQAEHETERQQWNEQRDQWELAEKRLGEQQLDAIENLREAADSLEAARSRSAELEQQLAETSQELTQYEQLGDSTRREKDANITELSKWRDLAENARKEVQQEREAHQRVRNEWHVERESLQRELAEWSKSLDALRLEQTREMEEAGSLIMSLQKEGKQLLAQLDEAKQAIRRDGDKHKRLHESHRNQKNDAAAANNTLLMPGRLGDDPRQSDDESKQPEPADSNVPEQALPREPVEQPDTVQSETVDPQVVDSRGSEEPDGVAGEPAPEPVEQSTANQTITMQRDEFAHDPEEAEPSSAASEQEAPTEVRTMALDPEDLQQQVEASHVDPMAAEVTEGVAAMFANAAVQREKEPDSADDEGVIQRYMERLLMRVASHGVEEPESDTELTPPTVPPVLSEQPTSTSDETVAVKVVDGVAGEEPVSSGSKEGVSLDPTTADKHHAQTPTPHSQTEMAADLLAMRKLANHSAREAIQSSEQRRFTAIAAGRLFVASVCLASSGLVIAMSSSKFSVQAAGGYIGLAFGTVMFLRGGCKFFSCRRMKKHLKADADTYSSEA